jgi:RNA polymerase sigma factor (TIGR02999 family)
VGDLLERNRNPVTDRDSAASALARIPVYNRKQVASAGIGKDVMDEITQLLQRARNGEPEQLDRVFAALYAELRRVAESRLSGGSQTLTPTALVHEVFLTLRGNENLSLNDRRHFFACAARSMRCIVVDHARRRSADRRGGGLAPVTLQEGLFGSTDNQDSNLLCLDLALDRLDRFDARQRQVVELHFFAGLTFSEVGVLLECSDRTAKRDWERARVFLHAELESD